MILGIPKSKFGRVDYVWYRGEKGGGGMDIQRTGV